MPNVRGPQFQGVNLRRPTRGPSGPAGPDRCRPVRRRSSAPLLPTQAVFRQKPWLPWWLAIVRRAADPRCSSCSTCCWPRTSRCRSRRQQGRLGGRGEAARGAQDRRAKPRRVQEGPRNGHRAAAEGRRERREGRPRRRRLRRWQRRDDGAQARRHDDRRGGGGAPRGRPDGRRGQSQVAPGSEGEDQRARSRRRRRRVKEGTPINLFYPDPKAAGGPKAASAPSPAGRARRVPPPVAVTSRSRRRRAPSSRATPTSSSSWASSRSARASSTTSDEARSSRLIRRPARRWTRGRR